MMMSAVHCLLLFIMRHYTILMNSLSTSELSIVSFVLCGAHVIIEIFLKGRPLLARGHSHTLFLPSLHARIILYLPYALRLPTVYHRVRIVDIISLQELKVLDHQRSGRFVISTHNIGGVSG